ASKTIPRGWPKWSKTTDLPPERQGADVAVTDSTGSLIAETEILERTILEEVVELHPECLTIPELILRIASDPEDGVKEERIRHATRELRRSGLFRYRNGDELVEPTHAALRAFSLLTA
ncbi:MAG TPA: hypothetical protein VIM28_00615, partial [Solirubrobacterales bacterium]